MLVNIFDCRFVDGVGWDVGVVVLFCLVYCYVVKLGLFFVLVGMWEIIEEIFYEELSLVLLGRWW